MRLTTVVLLVVAAVFAPASRGADASLSGFVAAEARAFPNDAIHAEQFGSFQPSLLLSPEFRYRTSKGDDQFTVVPFYRVDSQDSRRTHFDLREAYWLRRGEGWDLTVGLNKVFWGVTESRHLVDVINQTDFVEDIDEEDKLGQPMVNLDLQSRWGTVSLFLLPGFRERTFAGSDGRPRFPLDVDVDNPLYESSRGRGHTDFALRYSHYFGSWDVGVSYFRGTGREPTLLPDPGQERLTPYYSQINQAGVDLQYTKAAWLFKFEGIAREGQGETFGAAVGGVEYTFHQLVGAGDLGILVEYQYDGRDESAPFTAADDDVFFGARYAWNDSQDTSVLGGAVIDRISGEAALFVEAERRINQRLKLELESRLFTNATPTGRLYPFRNDSFVTARFAYFF